MFNQVESSFLNTWSPLGAESYRSWCVHNESKPTVSAGCCCFAVVAGQTKVVHISRDGALHL